MDHNAPMTIDRQDMLAIAAASALGFLLAEAVCFVGWLMVELTVLALGAYLR